MSLISCPTCGEKFINHKLYMFHECSGIIDDGVTARAYDALTLEYFRKMVDVLRFYNKDEDDDRGKRARDILKEMKL